MKKKNSKDLSLFVCLLVIQKVSFLMLHVLCAAEEECGMSDLVVTAKKNTVVSTRTHQG